MDTLNGGSRRNIVITQLRIRQASGRRRVQALPLGLSQRSFGDGASARRRSVLPGDGGWVNISLDYRKPIDERYGVEDARSPSVLPEGKKRDIRV